MQEAEQPVGAISDPIKDLAKLIPAATRAALEETFRLWHGAYAPEHFKRQAFGRYPDSYAASRKVDKEEWLRRHAGEVARLQKIGQGRRVAEVNPLQKSGRLQQAFLSGSYRFSGSNTRLRVTWPTLPSYATRPNRYSGFRADRALVEVSEREREEMGRVAREWIAAYLKRTLAIQPKTYGRMVIG